MARTAKIDFPTPNPTDPAIAALIASGSIKAETVKATLPANKAADGKDHPYTYVRFVAFDKAGVIALLGGKDLTAAVVSEYVTKRQKSNAYQKVVAQAEGPEKGVTNAIKDLLKIGYRPTAVKMAADALFSGDLAKAESFVSEVEKG